MTTRRLDRRHAGVRKVLAAMQAGDVLHLHFDQQRGPQWSLSSGGQVRDEVGSLVAQHPDVVGVGDGLFEGGCSQTFRFIDQNWRRELCQ